MRAWISVRSLLDIITEQVAIKSGVLLNDHELQEIISQSDMKAWILIFQKDIGDTVGVRPEFVEDVVRVIRASIGNLTDATPGEILMLRKLKEFVERGIDPKPIFSTFATVIGSGKYQVIGEEVVNEVIEITKASRSLVLEIFMVLAEQLDRGLNTIAPNEVKQWNGLVRLSALFNVENVPTNPEAYIDQRFLDYMAVNFSDHDRIHWRNFERFVAEYFKRIGYTVELGPSTSDGGIDIRIWQDQDTVNNPPLIVIQCKRHKETNEVKIEYIKAFWTDVAYEGAQHGILVTTSRIAPGGKKVSQARNWQLSFAEKEEVKKYGKINVAVFLS